MSTKRKQRQEIEYLSRSLSGGVVGVRFWDASKPMEAYDTGAESGEGVEGEIRGYLQRAGLVEEGKELRVRRAAGPGRHSRWLGQRA